MITVDARNLLCPMPVIRVQEAIEKARPGERIKARCTDPGAMHDIPAWAKIHGHKLIETSEQEPNEYIIVVEVLGS